MRSSFVGSATVFAGAEISEHVSYVTRPFDQFASSRNKHIQLLIAAACLVAAHVSAARADCATEAASAERAAGLPPGLLHAIGLRESGRRDPATGRVQPSPYAIDVDGAGYFPATREEAIATVADAQRRGARFIDVGCFQIDLRYHPMAFASLDEAFDPAANAAYAARYLASLHATYGSWPQAVAAYHSAAPAVGGPYRDAVYRTWLGGPAPDVAASAAPDAPPALPYVMLAGVRLWLPPGDALPKAAVRRGNLAIVNVPSRPVFHAGSY